MYNLTGLIKKLNEIHLKSCRNAIFIFSNWITAVIIKCMQHQFEQNNKKKVAFKILNAIHCMFISALSGYDMHNASFVNTFMRIRLHGLFFLLTVILLLILHFFLSSFVIHFSTLFSWFFFKILCVWNSKTTKEVLQTLDFLTYGMKIVSSVHSEHLIVHCFPSWL